MSRAPLIVVLLAAVAAGESAADALKDLRSRWPVFGRDQKIEGLLRLARHRSPAILEQCVSWLKEPDLMVRGQVVRVIAHCATDPGLRARSEKAIAAYLDRHLKERARKEKMEFRRICRDFGKKLPPDTEMAAGADWKDPYDEDRRKLPEEIVAERAHMREVIAAVEDVRAVGVKAMLHRVLEEHHDPEVLVRVIEAFSALRDWTALPAMADLLRIQEHGRATGGGDVIGRERFAELRLKWDVHKDRLWWSRPEYVPRVRRPVYAAAGAITGAPVSSARELDAWLLANGARLARHGVKLSAEFRARARGTQR